MRGKQPAELLCFYCPAIWLSDSMLCLLRPLIRYWRGRGLRAVLYLDDGIVAVKGKERATYESERVQSELSEVGLIVNNPKSQWDPTKSLVWLGFQINLQDGQLTVPDRKVGALSRLMQQARDNRSIRAMALAKITGKIISMAPSGQTNNKEFVHCVKCQKLMVSALVVNRISY